MVIGLGMKINDFGEYGEGKQLKNSTHGSMIELHVWLKIKKYNINDNHVEDRYIYSIQYSKSPITYASTINRTECRFKSFTSTCTRWLAS